MLDVASVALGFSAGCVFAALVDAYINTGGR